VLTAARDAGKLPPSKDPLESLVRLWGLADVNDHEIVADLVARRQFE